MKSPVSSGGERLNRPKVLASLPIPHLCESVPHLWLFLFFPSPRRSLPAVAGVSAVNPLAERMADRNDPPYSRTRMSASCLIPPSSAKHRGGRERLRERLRVRPPPERVRERARLRLRPAHSSFGLGGASLIRVSGFGIRVSPSSLRRSVAASVASPLPPGLPAFPPSFSGPCFQEAGFEVGGVLD